MAYVAQIHYYRQYKPHYEDNSQEKASLYDTILQRVYAEKWDNMDEKARRQCQTKLSRQLAVGRRWFIAINKLSHGALFLSGKKLSTLM
jgi:hypothetical protein